MTFCNFLLRSSFVAVLGVTACGDDTLSPPAAWTEPEVFVAPSSFAGVHGLAIDATGRLLAGSVVGGSVWEVDRVTGAARVFIGPPEGQADDIAVGPNGELAWTGFLQGVLRYRERDDAQIRVLATDLPGMNSVAFDQRNGKLYASQVFMGDALWEIDVAGVNPPRLIAKDMGGFNGFEVGPDGMLYGPLWFKHQVVKIDPANGGITVISSDFQVPAAANLDDKGNLWVVDQKAGELARVELATGRKTVAKTLKPALDNLAIAPEGTIYVSNMADNSIEAFDPATGELRLLTGGKLPLALSLRADGSALWVAGLFAFRGFDLDTGEISTDLRMGASDVDYPTSVGVSGQQLAVASYSSNTVQQIDRATMKTVAVGSGFIFPVDAIPMDDGSVLVAELGSGSILRASGPELKQREVIVQGLKGPMQMTLSTDGDLYFTEFAGTLTRLNLADKSKATLATDLVAPKGLAQTPWGSVVVMEVAARRLTEIDLATGERRTVAANLPVSAKFQPPTPPLFAPGVAVDGEGNVYYGTDQNAVYKLRPQW
jgi:sugar lactone lactonase YvrE